MAATAPLPALVLLIGAAIALTGCSVSIDLDSDATTRTERTSIPADDIGRLDVTTGNGAVDIRASDADQIEVVAILREADEGDATYRTATTGEALTVIGECDDGWRDPCSVGFEIDVPDDLDVTVTTDNGRIRVTALAGRLDLETDNGAVDGDALAAVDVLAQTDNGRIGLDFADAPDSVDARTDNGAVSIRVPDDGATYDVDASSGNGRIRIEIPSDPDATRRLVARTDNGTIDIEHTG